MTINMERTSFRDRSDDSLASRLDEVLERSVEAERIVGAVVFVARNGRTLYRRAVGQLDREVFRAMREDTPFRISSLTKPIVSVAALSLVERGAMGLDDPVTRFVPDFRPALADGSVPVITIRHLLTHTSGLGYGFFQAERDVYRAAGVSNGMDQPGLTFSENARRLSSVPLFGAPGSAFRYSLSTDVLGEAMARATSQSLAQVVEQTVTGPLGMNETTFVPPDPARLAVPYADGAPRPVRMADHHVVEFPGGAVAFAPARASAPGSYSSGGSGLISTAEDYLKFLEAVREDDARLLGADRFAALKRDQIGGVLRPTPVPGDGCGFGFGFGVLLSPERAESPLTAGSLRWEGSYGHTAFVDPAARLSVVALTNTTLEGMFGSFPNEVQRAVYAR